MTKKTKVSETQNIWFDTQKVDNQDLSVEQYYNKAIDVAIINNHLGTGIVPEFLEQSVIFDSSLFVGFLDGVAVSAQNQPPDNNLGNQLQISLINSNVKSRKSIKIAVIGLDFESNLQYETFLFKKNEIQVGKKHFTKVLVLLFNDFIGNPSLSLNLGGRLIISQAKSINLSRDPIMVAQSAEPDLFFRDFFIDGSYTLTSLLQTALPTYNIDTLNIKTSEKDNKSLAFGDVTTQYGQKFLAKTNNIQKITLLLSVINSVDSNDLVWNGDLVLNIYKLQTAITNPLDIVPETLIDFTPDPTPLAQLSFNYQTLTDSGIILDGVPQPVDFIFSNSPIAGGNIIKKNSYYAFSIKRAGSSNKCDILVAVSNNEKQTTRETVFTGTLWVDLPEESLWHQVWTDSAKVSDGQAYDTGVGIVIEKTIIDSDTQATIDYSFEGLQFIGNDVFSAMLSANTVNSTPIPSEITGNPVFSRQKDEPKIDMLNAIALSNIDQASESLLIGVISDKNRKYYDFISSQILSKIRSATIFEDYLVIKIVDDDTDTVRYDTSVNELVSNLLNGNFVGAKIIPNAGDSSKYYRIASAELQTMIVGDVDGNGIIDENDVDLVHSYYNYNLNVSPPITSVITTDNVNTTFTNGYTTLNNPFTNLFGFNFQLVQKTTTLVCGSGTDGVLVADPNNKRLAQLTSSSFNFSAVEDLDGYYLVITNNSTTSNYGGFEITSINTTTDVITVSKVVLSANAVSEMFRADIDGDFVISSDDGYLLSEYVKNNPDPLVSGSVLPRPTSNEYAKIGTTFNIVKFVVEAFDDRNDDYTSAGNGRAAAIHIKPDMFLADGYFVNHNYYNNPAQIIFEKRLTWDESLIIVNSLPKYVPSVFTSPTGYTQHSCVKDGIINTTYPQPLEFDRGKIDYFIPDNLIIGSGGSFKNEDGTDYKIDFEVGTIVLEIPDGLFGSERTINVIEDFVAEYEGRGTTRIGYPAMKYADCTYVQLEDLANDRIRFTVSMQAFSPNIEGLSEDGYEGVIIDNKMGVFVNYEDGQIILNFTNLYEDQSLPTLSTKIQVTVFLKKASFNNKPQFIDSDRMNNLLKLISVFSGANVGGVSALVDLENDTAGVLPIIHGGTGLSTVGANGTVLTSNGTGLQYSFISSLGGIGSSTGIPDANKTPKTDGYGLIDPSFYYKQPLSLYALAGVASNETEVPIVIGAFKFRFDEYILQGLQSIKLETILEVNLPSGAPNNPAKISLFDVSNQEYLVIGSPDTYISTANEYSTVVISDDLKSLLLEGATDFIYEVHLFLTNAPDTITYPLETDTAICKGARLILDYNNPYATSVSGLVYSKNFHPNPGI